MPNDSITLRDGSETATMNCDESGKSWRWRTYYHENEGGFDDFVIVPGRYAKAPGGYKKVDIDLNHGAGGSYLWLCCKPTFDWIPGKLKQIHVLAGHDQYIPCPDGFKKDPTDLNAGAGGLYLYLCFSDQGSRPISGIGVIEATFSLVGKPLPADLEGWTLYELDLNAGAGGMFIYFVYTYK